MRILVPQPRGFCAGVEMALRALDRTLERDGVPLYAFHQIVHNVTVVQHYEQLGVTFVDDVNDVPMGSTIVFSAHGVSPAVRHDADARRLRIVDATCPLVEKVHREAHRFAARGARIVLIAHAGHDETTGILGEAPDQITVIAAAAEVDGLTIPPGASVAYTTQTTLSVDETQAVIAALRRRFPDIQGPPAADICYATQNRQDAVRALAGESDVLVVLGSLNSSNSVQLARVGAQRGIPAFRIDGPAELDRGWFGGIETVLLTAGASAPEALVRATADWFVAQYGATIEHRQLSEETVHFQLPLALRGNA
jgi:4-hydroxy-3-methylbut-2-en-1-yl diphosphate reductase